jgi:DNA primase
MRDDLSIQERIAKVKADVDMVALVGKVTSLSKGRNPRGKCPFHGSKSDSFAVYPGTHGLGGHARCWGCGWSGDAIGFLRDHDGLDFMAALQQLERDAGTAPSAASAAVQRARNPVRTRRSAARGEPVDAIVLGRYLWKIGRPASEHGARTALLTYLGARGVPVTLLSARRLSDVRFVAMGPIVPWRSGERPDAVPQAPSMVVLVRRKPESGLAPLGGLDDWPPVAVHVTFLAPDLMDKMARKRADGSDYPARKMMGPVSGGGVWLPGELGSASVIANREGPQDALPADAMLVVGEGLETVLSGLAMVGGDGASAAWGLATLSLDNLQGFARTIKQALPLYDPVPDDDRAPALCFAHGGPVIGLIDADMKPLKGPIDRETGASRGVKLIEVRRGPVVQRTMSQGERATLCATLFARCWRAAGCAKVRTVRPHLGMDFNDAIQEMRDAG